MNNVLILLQVGQPVRFECNARVNNAPYQDRITVTWSKEGSNAQTLDRDPRFQITGGDARTPCFLVVSYENR